MTASDQNVVLQQWLFYKQRGTFTMAYHHFWGVLKRESRYGRTRLELYESSRPNSRLALTLPLIDVFHVMNRSARARSHAFQILGMGTKYHFAARTETECRAWMDAITKVTTGLPETGVEYEFCVTVMCNQYSTALSLTGNYLLCVSDTHATLMSSNGMLCSRFNCHLLDLEKVVFANMDCSKQRLSILTLHTMSTSAVSQGTFVFQASSARDIAKVINERISLLGGQPSSETKKRDQTSKSLIQKLPLDKTGSLDWNCLRVQDTKRKARTIVQRSASIDAISPASAEPRLPGLSTSSYFLFEDSTSSSDEASSPSHSISNVSRSVDDLLMSDSTAARRDFALRVSECSQNLTPIHQKVPCEEVPVNNEAWQEPEFNGAIRQCDSCTQLMSLPPLPDSSNSSSSSLVASDSHPCRKKSPDTATDIFGDALQAEDQGPDPLRRNPFFDYVNSSSIIRHFRDMKIQRMSSHSHSNESLPSATPNSLQLSPKHLRHRRPVPLPRKMHSMQELPVVTPLPRSQPSQRGGRLPGQSRSSGQLPATGHGGALETTSLQHPDSTRRGLSSEVPNLTLGVDLPEIATPDKRASTEDLLDKIELWIPEWRKEEYLSAQKKCKEKHRAHSGHGTYSPERRLRVAYDFACVRDRADGSDDDSSPQSPVYLDILSDFTASESPKGVSSPSFSPAAIVNEELTSPQTHPTNFTHPPRASSLSPSMADRKLYPTKNLSSPLSSKDSPRVGSFSLSGTPTLPLGHHSSSFPFMTCSEFSSLDSTRRRIHSHDHASESLESSGSQQGSPRHQLLHDVTTPPTKAISESPDGWRNGHSTGPEAYTGIHAHTDLEQSLISQILSSLDEQREDSETTCSEHVDEPLYSSIASTACNHECALDLSIQSDDYYDRPNDLLPTGTPTGTPCLLPLGEVIDPYSRISEDQLRVLASRPPAVPPVPPSPPPRTSPEKSSKGSRARKSSTDDYIVYDYPYMSQEARKRMILRMLRKQEEREEKGLYIEMCKPKVPPRPQNTLPQNTLPSLQEYGSPQHHVGHHVGHHQLLDHNPRSAFDKLPSLPSTPTTPPLHFQATTPSYV